MHGKDLVIAPALEQLGLRVIACPGLDTDSFGTFTRDIARSGNQHAALLAKAKAGLALAGQADFAVASEGAFGPHPQMPIVPTGLELVGIVERTSSRSIIGMHQTIDIHFARVNARTTEDVAEFVRKTGRADHSWVVMATRDGPIIAKGLSDPDMLLETAVGLIAQNGSVWLETDMRAHRNPTRMRAIAAAAADLVRRLRARCPRCDYPDWVGYHQPGRPCAWCATPTDETWYERFDCENCGHGARRKIEEWRAADPGRCPSCNP